MNKPVLLVTRRLPGPVLDEAARQFDLRLWERDEPIGDAFEEWALGCDAVLVMATDRLDKGRLQSLATHARAVATYSVGYEHIDVDAATACGLPVFNTPDVLSDAVAEIAMFLILAAARDTSAAEATLRSGRWGPWSPTRFLGAQLTDRRLGVFGMGRIGRAVAQRAAGFGLRIHYHNRSEVTDAGGAVYHATLGSLLQVSDVLCVCAPSTPQTCGVLDAKRLALLPEGAIFVNIARGDLVHEPALIEALASGRMRAAGLDVYRNEPAIDPRFLALPRATLLPHIGSATEEARIAMGLIALRALVRCLQEAQASDNCLNPATLQERRRS
jgi:lactate dehydrogenase-like 2-hydroxyacid dehydrogenase